MHPGIAPEPGVLTPGEAFGGAYGLGARVALAALPGERREHLLVAQRALEAHGLRAGRTASRALGYQQVLAALAGECTDAEARAETVRATKRFARRQDSWFRRDPRVHWLSGAAADLTELPELALALVERPVTA